MKAGHFFNAASAALGTVQAMEPVEQDTFRPVGQLFELPTRQGVILVLDKKGRTDPEVAAAVQDLIQAAREHLSDISGSLAPTAAVFEEWWQLGYDSHLGHLSPMWNLYLLAPARTLPLG